MGFLFDFSDEVDLFHRGKERKKKASKKVGVKEGRSRKRITRKKMLNPCEQCGLYKACLTPKMSPTGEGRLRCLIIGEAPGATEDEVGTQFIGSAGQILRRHLRRNGVELDRDFWKTNAVACRPPDNRKPTNRELKYCSVNLKKAFDTYRPKFVFLFGDTALTAYFSLFHPENKSTLNKLSIGDIHGQIIPDLEAGVWVVPLYHPSFLQYTKDAEAIFAKDLRKAVGWIKRDKELPNVDVDIKLLTSHEDVITLLKGLSSSKVIVFDYETNSLFPFKGISKILTISVVGKGNTSYCFPFQYRNHWKKEELEEIENLWKKILVNPSIKKVAHNVKFEDIWSRNILGVVPEGWVWDSMIAAHILNEAPGTTRLKVQTFLNFGYIGYEEEVAPHMKGRGEFNINTLEEVDFPVLGRYNALDSYFTNLLFKKQQRLMNSEDRRAMDFSMEVTNMLCDLQVRGIRVDTDYLLKAYQELERKCSRLLSKLGSSKEAQIFLKREGREVDWNSTKDLRVLFYDIMKQRPSKLTRSGVSSVDKEALEGNSSELAKELLRLRRLEKVKSTYIKQIERESFNGMIYPSIDIHTVRTYRTSSSRPNLQNIPKREETAKKYVRRAFYPRKGHKLLSADYSGAEVRIMACYSKDPVLIDYLKTGYDMHKEWAAKLYRKPISSVTKKERFNAKNGFVFPEFYGSWYVSVAKSLGLSENHVKRVEQEFWKVFKVMKKWQENLWKSYLSKGYVEYFFGFKRKGVMNRNRVINSPIQGTATHCLLWSMCKINDEFKGRDFDSRVIYEIHDEIMCDVNPSEEEEVKEVVERVMTKDIVDAFPWIVVPFEVEISVGEIDKSWYELK